MPTRLRQTVGLCAVFFFLPVIVFADCRLLIAGGVGRSFINLVPFRDSITQLKSLTDESGLRELPVLRAAVRGDRNARVNFTSSQSIFSDLDLFQRMMILNSASYSASNWAAPGSSASAVDAITNYLSALEIPFIVKTRFQKSIPGLETQVVIVADEYGDNLQQLAFAVEKDTGYKIAVDADLSSTGYVDAQTRTVNIGVQALFLLNFGESVVLQHEIAHLPHISTEGELFSLFTGYLTSKIGAIDVKKYRRYFHLSEVPATIAAIATGLRNLILLSDKIDEPRVRMEAIQLRSQLEWYALGLKVDTDLIYSICLSLNEYDASSLRVTPGGFQFRLNPKGDRPYAFNRGFVSLRGVRGAPNGYLALSDDKHHYRVPLPKKYHRTLTPTTSVAYAPWANVLFRPFLGTVQNAFADFAVETFGTEHMSEVYLLGYERHTALRPILDDIVKNPRALRKHLPILKRYLIEFSNLNEDYRRLIEWPEIEF